MAFSFFNNTISAGVRYVTHSIDLEPPRHVTISESLREIKLLSNFYSSYLWRIENFSQYYDKDLVDVKTPRIMFDSTEWELSLALNKDTKHNEFQIFIRLTKRPSSNGTFAAVKWRMFFVDKNGCKQLIQKYEVRCSKGIRRDVFCLEKHSLLGKSFGDLLQNDCLTICFDLMSHHYDLLLSSAESDLGTDSSNSSLCLEYLSENLLSMLNNSCMTDVILSVRGRKFNAHKCILSVRSKRFSSMFKEMTERNESVVDIFDVEAPDMHNLLIYIYSGKVSDLPDDRLLNLYVAADKYALPMLKSRCRELIASKLNKVNIWNVLNLAEEYPDRELCFCVKKYLALNDSILYKMKWKKYAEERTELANEIMQFVSKQY